ncbi:MAG: adenylate/guanylate cyclase domain-containing protein [Rhizobiaceae bacterium]|nr:adenylate/guanylate cyclase domain-containing protein [Rhizobiaceae bacterium]
MNRNTLITEIGEWLIDQALAQPNIVDLFTQVCLRLTAAGVPLSRCRLMWPTLHPLFQAETVLWTRGQETKFNQFAHQDDVSDEWLNSPMHFVYENGLDTLRRNLDGPNKMVDFAILEELIELGHTDYMLISTAFSDTQVRNTKMNGGIMVMWSSDRPGGFSDDDLATLKKIQRRFAAACKNVVQNRIALNITETYLGQHAGRQVLDGAIKLGDGRETQAVVWYSDMRRSTELADTMSPDDFLQLLNDYFECTAGPAIECGGEVLDFIGDAVLVIFPFENDEDMVQAVRCATLAMERSMQCVRETNERRRSHGMTEFDFGIGLNTGTVMFGNIGVASRLSFSVVGPTINEVERIETLTKAVDAKALATREVANLRPEDWTSIGEYQLKGVAGKTELFAYNEIKATITDTPMSATKENVLLN